MVGEHDKHYWASKADKKVVESISGNILIIVVHLHKLYYMWQRAKPI